MLKTILFLIVVITTFLHAQSQFQDFLNRVNSLSDPTEKAAVIDSFMTVARVQGIPFIEGNDANFIYLGNPSTVGVPGDFNGWNFAAAPMINLVQTNFWYYSKEFELNARLDYKFVLNGSNWILDPENPNTILGGFGPNSELAMPEYIQPWEIEYNPNIVHGTVENKSIFSSYLNSTYQIKIYLPPGYNRNLNYPAVYFQDGFEYIDLASTINVFDNLIDSNKIIPLIGVFVKPNNRNTEYGGDLRNEYRLFFTEELVPFIDSTYNTMADAAKRLVMGPSLGGNISSLISYNHPEVFANCGIHSGALWVNNNEALTMIITGTVKDIKWSSIWGSYEGLSADMHLLKDSLISKGYELEWLELPEGHSWGLWRATIDNMLTFFFPSSATNVEDNDQYKPEKFYLFQNYPNPFNPSTKIKFTIPLSEKGGLQNVKVIVYDVLGNKIATIVNEEKPAGTYEVTFHTSEVTSGIYFYNFTAGKFTVTKKMILLK